MELEPPRKYMGAELKCEEEPPIFRTFTYYPPLCMFMHNYVMKIKLSGPVEVKRVVEKFDYCKVNMKNMRAISFCTRYPNVNMSVYDSGTMRVVGISSFRCARAVVDRYVGLLRECGYPDLHVLSMKPVNIGCCVSLDFTVDLDEYARREPKSIYLPYFAGCGVAGQAETLVSHGTFTVFHNKVNIVGARSMRDVCYDFKRLYAKYKECSVPLGSVRETKLLRKRKLVDQDSKRKRKKPTTTTTQ